MTAASNGRVSAPARGRAWGTVAAIAAASLAVRLAFAASLGIFQDEALYWWCAQDNAASFCPSPPAVPLMVRWGEAALGPGVLGVRAGSLLCGTAGIVLAAALAAEFYGHRAAAWAAALFAVCPLMAVVSSVATPEAPVVCLWLLFAWTAWRAARTDHMRWWVASGVVLAAGGYAKYMMALAAPCAFLALCASGRGRRLLGRPGPWVAAGLGLVLFGSVFVAWNARHGWAAVRFHLAARHTWTFSWARLGGYVLGHLGAISPVICVGVFAAFVGLWRSWRRSARRGDAWLLSFGLVPILFFLVPSLFTKRLLIRVHWDLIGYAVGIVALAGLIAGQEGGRRRRRLGVASVAAGALITVALFASSFWPALAVAAGTRPPTVKMLGWEELAARVREMEAGHGLRAGRWDEPRFILTSSFHSALCLAFQRGSREGIYTIRSAHDRRYGLTAQLEAWGIDEERALAEHFAHDAIYIHEFRRPDRPGPKDQPRRVYRYFEALEGRTGDRNWLTRHELEPLAEAKVTIAGRTVRRFGLYRAHQQLLPP